MAPSTPEEFLADKPISELRNYSKYDWLFAVFQLYVESCDWKSLHFIYLGSEIIRQEQILDEKYKGLGIEGKSLANFRAWNQLAGIPTKDFRVGEPELESLDNALLSPQTAKSFTKYMELLPRALESYSYSETKSPIPVAIWVEESTRAIEQALQKPDCKETLNDLLELPCWDWPLDSPLDLWPHGQFSLDCYYYANLFASWLQNEPAFFSQLRTPGHLGVNKAKRTAEMDATLKSLIPLIQWEHTLDVQQAFLELWWRDEPEHQKQLFRAVETIDEQSKQFFTAINSIHEQIHRAEDRGLSSEQAAQFHDAVEHVKFQIEHYHQSDSLRLDLNMDKRTNPDLKGIIPMLRLERPVLEKVIAFFLTKDFFYYDFYSIPNKSFAKARQEKVARIKQKEREQNESCSNALILAKMPFHQLKVRPQTDWLFAALEMFTVYYPWPESDDLEEHAQCPFLGLSQTERLSLIQRERDQGIHLKRMRSWNLYPGDDDNSYGPAIQAWVNEKIDRIGKAIASNSQSDEITFQNICIPDATHQWVIYGNPPRWWLYAALFNRLLADPPQWLNELPMKEINATIEASGNQPLKYASEPYQELLNGGYYKVMLGIYERTHGELPALPTDEAEREFIIQQRDRVYKDEVAWASKEFQTHPKWKYHRSLIEEWVLKTLDRLELFSSNETRLSLSVIIPEELPFLLVSTGRRITPPKDACLKALWINIVRQPPEWMQTLSQASTATLPTPQVANSSQSLNPVQFGKTLLAGVETLFHGRELTPEEREEAVARAREAAIKQEVLDDLLREKFRQELGEASKTPGQPAEQNCPYDLIGLTTIDQRDRFNYIWQNRPTLNEIKNQFKIDRKAWHKWKEDVNARLKDCKIQLNSGDSRYEVVNIPD